MGRHIISQLLARGLSTTVLTRPVSGLNSRSQCTPLTYYAFS
jgi:hypothetical protein